MKKIFFLSFFAVLLIAACEKPTPPNGDPADPIDTTSLSYYLGGEWECVIFLNDRSFELDTVVLTRTFYPSEKKFYQTVRSVPNVDPRNRLQFGGNEGWNNYDLREDTLYWQVTDGYYDESVFSYIIYQLSPDTMGMSHRGWLLANMIRDYLFIRKNH